MPDPVVVKSRPIQRNELASFLPNDKLIRDFEALTTDVARTLPAATDQVALTAQAAKDEANAASAAAAAAQARADEAYELAAEQESTTPSVWVLLAEIHKLRARVAALEQGMTP